LIAGGRVRGDGGPVTRRGFPGLPRLPGLGDGQMASTDHLAGAGDRAVLGRLGVA